VRIIPSFANRCVVTWSAELVPPAAGPEVDGKALEAAAAEAARREIEAFLDAAKRAL